MNRLYIITVLLYTTIICLFVLFLDFLVLAISLRHGNPDNHRHKVPPHYQPPTE